MITARTARGWDLLRERTFRRYWSARTVSFFGDQISMLALPRSRCWCYALAGADGLPHRGWPGAQPDPVALRRSVAGPPRHRRYVMIAADLARALLVASIPIAYALVG